MVRPMARGGMGELFLAASGERGFEKPSDDVGRRGATTRPRTRFCRQDRRQAIEKLPHPRREHLLEPRERIREVALKWCSGDCFEQVAAQVERAEFRQRESRFEAVERLAVDSPVHAAVVVALVVERKSGLLERGKIAADGTRRDLELRREGVNRGTVP